MSTNIQRIVKEDISNKITQRHIILEAISNSIQANASSITCELYSYQPVLKDDTGEIVERKIDKIKVIDNGEGFTDENIKSFKVYRTDHKIDLGCKGVGRLLFLKLFETVTYISCLAKEKYKVTFPLNFSLDNIEPQKENYDDPTLEEDRTILELKDTKHFDKTTLENPVNKYFRKFTTNNNLPVTTIHEVKGMTFDSVFLILSANSKGQNISLNDFVIRETMLTEKQRLIYVATSRPRYLLCLGIPSNIANNDLKQIFTESIIIIQ